MSFYVPKDNKDIPADAPPEGADGEEVRLRRCTL